MIAWAKTAHDIWQKNGTPPEELRAKTKPNWRKDLQIYEQRMRARKIKQNRIFN